MKAKLEFNLPEEETDLRTALNGNKWESVLWHLDQKLRNIEKWENKETIDIDKVRDMIYDEMKDHDLFWTNF